jgi:hypothetical protein
MPWVNLSTATELAEFVLVLANTFSGRDGDIRLVKLSANIAVVEHNFFFLRPRVG